MARTECNPECRCCGRTIDTENEETIKVIDGFIHIECEEEYLEDLQINNELNALETQSNE